MKYNVGRLATVTVSALLLASCATAGMAWKAATGSGDEFESMDKAASSHPLAARLKTAQQKQKAADFLEAGIRKDYFGVTCEENSSSCQSSIASRIDSNDERTTLPYRIKKWVELQADATDDMCEVYTSGLDALANVSRYAHDTTSNLFNVTQVILGLTGTAAQTLAIIASAESGLNNQWNLTDRFMFLAPEPYLVKKAAIAKMKQYKNQNSIGSIRDYGSAREWIREHASKCTPSGLRLIVHEGVTGATPGNVTQQTVNQAAIVTESVLASLRGRLSVKSISNEDLSSMYWYFVIASKANDKERDAAKDKLKLSENTELVLKLKPYIEDAGAVQAEKDADDLRAAKNELYRYSLDNPNAKEKIEKLLENVSNLSKKGSKRIGMIADIRKDLETLNVVVANEETNPIVKEANKLSAAFRATATSANEAVIPPETATSPAPVAAPTSNP